MIDQTILHLTGMHSLKYGSIERYLLELAKHASHKGYRTIIQYESCPRSAEYMRDLEIAGCSLAIVSIGSTLASSLLKVIGLIQSLKPMIIQTHFVRGYIYLLLPLAASLFGTRKLLAMVHGLQKRHSVWRYIAFNYFDYVIGVSQGVVDSLLALGIRPQIVKRHYLGLFGEIAKSSYEREKLRTEFSIPQDAIVIACIAFDSKIKGVDILLEAMAAVSERYPKLHLFIIGIDPNLSDLPSEAARLGIAQCTHWTGIRDEGWRLLNIADLYIQPSRSEAMPFAVMEAMALRLPVVGTKVGGLPEIITDGETGWLIEPTCISMVEMFEAILYRQQDWGSKGDKGYLRYCTFFRGEDSVKIFVETYY